MGGAVRVYSGSLSARWSALPFMPEQANVAGVAATARWCQQRGVVVRNRDAWRRQEVDRSRQPAPPAAPVPVFTDNEAPAVPKLPVLPRMAEEMFRVLRTRVALLNGEPIHELVLAKIRRRTLFATGKR